MVFGQYIKEQRLLLGLSSRKLSEMIGKSSSYISSIEKGLYKPDYQTAYKILKELKVENSKVLMLLRDFGVTASKNRNESSTDLNPSKNSEKPNYQKLYEDRQNEVIEQLIDVLDQIKDDISNYPSDYDACEGDTSFEPVDKFLTTFISIMLHSEIEIFNKFHELMRLPLHKLNPIQFQKVIDCASNLIEYEYVFESGESSKTQKYPHHRVKYKEK